MTVPPGQDVAFAFVIGGVVGLLAAICAGVITYSTYHNQFMDTGKPVQLALHSALTSFLVFFFLAGLLALTYRTIYPG